MGIWQKIIGTSNSWPLLIARLALGIVMFPHGAQKALGWFGGNGFAATMSGMSEHMGIPALFVLLAIAAEFLGSLGLIFGALGRIAAFGVGFTMLVAVIKVHGANGFFMNWMGNQKGEGFEYHLLAMGLALVVMIGGSGALSIDRMLSRGKADK